MAGTRAPGWLRRRRSIAVSVLLRAPGVEPGKLGWLPLLTGIAVVDALRGVAKVRCGTEVAQRRCSSAGARSPGILAEVSWPKPADSAAGPAVVVGVGFNVWLTEEELPVPQATSLALLGAEVTDRTTLARAMLRALAERWKPWEEAGWATDDLAAAYRERCVTLGARVRADLPGGESVEGTARDIDADGRLLIVRDGRADGGNEHGGEIAVAAGDVTHLQGCLNLGSVPAMGYPEDALAPDEELLLHCHPHWKMLVVPASCSWSRRRSRGLPSVLAAEPPRRHRAAPSRSSSCWCCGGRSSPGAASSAHRVEVTHFIVTDRRVLIRQGVLTHTGIDIPMGRISNVQFRHGLVDRMLRTGTLIIGSASEDPLEFDDIPHVQRVHSLLYHQVFDAMQFRSGRTGPSRRLAGSWRDQAGLAALEPVRSVVA